MWEIWWPGYDIKPLDYGKRTRVVLLLEKWAACKGTAADLASIQQRKDKLKENIKLIILETIRTETIDKMIHDLEGWWIQPGEELVLS